MINKYIPNNYMIKIIHYNEQKYDQDYELISIIDNNDFLNLNVLEESKLFDMNHNELNHLTSDNSMVLFDASKYLKNILASYYYNINKINHQLTVDFPRSSLTYNNKLIKNIAKAQYKFNLYSKYPFVINNTEYNLGLILSMLCTQASFAFSFALMHQVYSDYKNNMCVTSNNNKFIVTTNNESINIEINATYNLKNLTDCVNVKQIDIQTNIDFVYKNNKYDLCKFGIIWWKCY